MLTERQHLTELYLDALHQQVEALEQTGDLERALQVARRAVATDPLREESHYDLMRLYAAAGQPSATLRQYQELERLLREELGETPSAATRALAEELQQSARTIIVARSTPSAPIADRQHPTPGLLLSAEKELRLPAEPRAARGGASGREPGAAPKALLPAQFDRFFGREEEIARLEELLCSSVTRLVTLTGPGGSGKTRLGIAVASRLELAFEGAVGFVPLADLTDARQMPGAIADALGLVRAAEVEPLAQVIDALSSRPWLLLLDNFEHLVAGVPPAEGPAGAPLVRSLLEQVPTLTCLVTSRQPLGITGEREFVLLPLPTPRRSDPPERLALYPSVQLFLDRAQAVRGDFQLTQGNAAAVAELCDRLDGLPLALELAAARAGVLTPQQMLTRLTGAGPSPAPRFELLVSRQWDVSSRHRSLRAAIESSYRLLSPALQRFFARLSVFRGGWTLEAPEAVCEAPDTLDCLEQLRQCSLVYAEEAGPPAGAAMRYRLLEALREFAAEQLSPEERAALERRHAEYFLALVEAGEAPRGPAPAADRCAVGCPPTTPTEAEAAGAGDAAPPPSAASPGHTAKLGRGVPWAPGASRVTSAPEGQGRGPGLGEPTLPGPERGQWLDRLEQEHDNLRAALDWSLAATDAERERCELGLRLAAALAGFWFTRGFMREGRERLTAALARMARWPEATASDAMPAPPLVATDLDLWAKALDGAGKLALAQSDFGTARALFERRKRWNINSMNWPSCWPREYHGGTSSVGSVGGWQARCSLPWGWAGPGARAALWTAAGGVTSSSRRERHADGARRRAIAANRAAALSAGRTGMAA